MISILRWHGALHLICFSLISIKIHQISAFEEIPDLNLSLNQLPIEIEDSPPTSPHHNFHHPIEIEDSSPTSPLKDQEEPHVGLGYMGDNSQSSFKRKRKSGFQKGKEPQSSIQGFSDIQDMEGLNDERLVIPKSSKKPKISLKHKDIGGSSSSKLHSSSITSIYEINNLATKHNLIPESILKKMDTWFIRLQDNISDKIKGHPPRPDRKRIILPHVKKGVSKAKAVATSFLACLKLLYADQHHNMEIWEESILEEGWIFMKSIFELWNEMEQDDLKMSKNFLQMTRILEHVDDLQPEYLYHQLSSVGTQHFPITFLWHFWRRWYREFQSTYPVERFFATASSFLKNIQYSILHNGLIDSSKDPEEILQSLKPVDIADSHQQMIREYILQIGWPKIYSPNSEIQSDHLEFLMHHVGHIELRLLEHHQPVEEWLESLNQHFATKLYRLQQNENPKSNEDTLRAISRCIGDTYSRLIPLFFGAVKFMEDSKSVLPAKNEDKNISQSWKFIKTYLDHWKKIDLRDGVHLELSKEFSKDQISIESHTLFLTMLNLKNDSKIPLEIISKLYYLKNLSPTNAIEEHGIRYQDAILKQKMIESFFAFQDQVV
ncbi:hypothetical protein DFH28DRAFT_376236 [Melampsora americana]|nr:hypothetical protein DFH28DRAFT_376236 [Melampsora americana]